MDGRYLYRGRDLCHAPFPAEPHAPAVALEPAGPAAEEELHNAAPGQLAARFFPAAQPGLASVVAVLVSHAQAAASVVVARAVRAPVEPYVAVEAVAQDGRRPSVQGVVAPDKPAAAAARGQSSRALVGRVRAPVG